ncbi:hypothetical protein HELRODRAFT_94235 [Helobdella robusta]|uniref:Uncharacterized protein n=1 Tax=Helobdella robusta TaxID=6412 RepID=T1G8Z6_HELRO|nr:hypothetical protein HELRODRAFT_94235 [Helobdella robusta]ESO06709.1 hypothetical protein HELRODRAFT_94235 [Helobdella robusta]
MNDFNEPDTDGCPEIYLSHWEKKYLEDWDKESFIEERILAENEKTTQKLWSSFQSSASAITDLHKEGQQRTVISLWLPFQTAASNATLLYRDGLEAVKKNFELGQQLGQLRRTKEILSWAKKRRRNIQRDELIAFLCGKPAPVRHHRINGGSRMNRIESLPRYLASNGDCNRDGVVDLQLFRDALGIQNQGNSRRSPSRSLCEDFLLVDTSSRKRPNDRLDSPSNNKRQKICGMEIEDY